MRIESTKLGELLIVKVLDSRVGADVAAVFKEAMGRYVDQGNKAIGLDLADVTFIDSTGLGAIIATLKKIGADGDMVLIGAHDTVASMLKLTRMDKVFRMFVTAEDAAAALSR